MTQHVFSNPSVVTKSRQYNYHVIPPYFLGSCPIYMITLDPCPTALGKSKNHKVLLNLEVRVQRVGLPFYCTLM